MHSKIQNKANTSDMTLAGKKLNILSIDGGGIRGIIPLIILLEITMRSC